jgi:hypothetical protein
VELTAALWHDSDPAAWRRAATDWRALAAADAADRVGREAVAELAGYATPNKVSNLRADGHELRAAAAAGVPDAVERLARAEALGRLLAERARA